MLNQQPWMKDKDDFLVERQQAKNEGRAVDIFEKVCLYKNVPHWQRNLAVK